MPRINRRVRIRKQQGGLAQSQREILLFGDAILDQTGPGFASPAAEQAAWRRHRAELMQEPFVNGPGKRPCAFLKFELGCEDAYRFTDFQVIQALSDHGLVGPDEALQIERAHDALSATQSPTLYDGFATPESIRRMQVNAHSLTCTAVAFDFVAKWHEQRGRAELAAKYSRLAGVIRSVLADHVL